MRRENGSGNLQPAPAVPPHSGSRRGSGFTTVESRFFHEGEAMESAVAAAWPGPFDSAGRETWMRCRPRDHRPALWPWLMLGSALITYGLWFLN
jgi:hypothetical protein